MAFPLVSLGGFYEVDMSAITKFFLIFVRNFFLSSTCRFDASLHIYEAVNRWCEIIWYM